MERDFLYYFNYTSQAFAVPLIMFYLFILYILFKFRKTDFKSTFFTFFIVVAVGDIGWGGWLCFSNYLLLGWFDWQIYLGKTLNWDWVLAIFHSAVLVQLFGLWFMTVNRFTALVFPTHYKKMWEGRGLMCSVLILALAGMEGFTFMAYDNGLRFLEIENETSLFVFFTGADGADFYGKWMFVYACQMLFSGPVLSLINALYSYYLVSHIFNYMNPFILLMFCSNLRKRVKEVLGMKSDEAKKPIVNVAPNMGPTSTAAPTTTNAPAPTHHE